LTARLREQFTNDSPAVDCLWQFEAKTAVCREWSSGVAFCGTATQFIKNSQREKSGNALQKKRNSTEKYYNFKGPKKFFRRFLFRVGGGRSCCDFFF
jgi:hypothetical protein